MPGRPRAAIIALSSLWIAAWVGIDHWQRQPSPEFAVAGIALLAWYAVGVLLLAGVLAGVSRPRPSFGDSWVIALGAVPLPLLLASVLIYVLEPRPLRWAGAAVAVYVVLYLARGLKAVVGRSQPLAALCGVIFIAAFMAASDAVDAIPDVWNPRDAEASTTAPGEVSEDELAKREAALFDQADRIDDAADGVDRDAAEGSEAFFLGFAGVGEQKVFAEEIGLAARVVGERFHVDTRGFSLLNDARDLDSAPLASVTGLSYALESLAGHMQLDRDVLFLAISSHGSADPSIAVSNVDMPFTALTPEDLADALREAGIRWKVIMISACYAGGFIDALRDPQTIVITAAAKDKTSFGCANDRDLTYFGEAFYRDALPGAHSLRDAFTTAKAAIALRERHEHVTASDPQAWFGPDMEAKLGDLERAAPGARSHNTITARGGTGRAGHAGRRLKWLAVGLRPASAGARAPTADLSRERRTGW